MKLFVFLSASLSIHSTFALSIATKADSSVEKRGAIICEPNGVELQPGGYYELDNKIRLLTPGTQCSQVTGTPATVKLYPGITWWTKYDTPTVVPIDDTEAVVVANAKAFPNIALKKGLPVQISSIESIPTFWNWTYTSVGAGLVSDVSYKLVLANGAISPVGTPNVELNVWLATRGGYTPPGTLLGTYAIELNFWQLYLSKPTTTSAPLVYTFVFYKRVGITDGEAKAEDLNIYKGDLVKFILFLTDENSLAPAYYLTELHAGSEYVRGSAYVDTFEYGVAVYTSATTV